LITAIAQIGAALREESDVDDLVEALVDRTVARNVLVLRFDLRDNGAKYVGIDIEQKGRDGLYLYRRDPAGRWTGLFLTGRITKFDFLMLQRNLKLSEKDRHNKTARDYVDEFLRKKLDRLCRSAIVSDPELLSTLNKSSLGIIKSIMDEFKSASKVIHKDFLDKIRKLQPEELLLTPVWTRASHRYHLGEVAEFVKVFKAAVTRTKDKNEGTVAGTSQLCCSICNGVGASSKFSQAPLPFVTTDKPGFIPNGDKRQEHKVFPLCSKCFSDLQRGRKFMENYLDFSIPSVEGSRAEVRFWLVPVVSNPQSVIPFLKDIGGSATSVGNNKGARLLYLRNLRQMCERMDVIPALALGDYDATEAQLSFTALFYIKDRQGHMRLFLSSEGIYPRQLKRLSCTKNMVDSLHPFEKERVRFGFPLLREFLATPKSEGWCRELSSILADMFTGRHLNKELLYKATSRKIQEVARKEPDLQKIEQTSLRALSLMEFVEHLEPSLV
jgi:hypothetical protein